MVLLLYLQIKGTGSTPVAKPKTLYGVMVAKNYHH